jgi:hypothetical protein
MGRHGHPTSTTTDSTLARLSRPGQNPLQLKCQHLNSESRFAQVSPDISKVDSKPLKVGKHQNPVHRLSELKLFLGNLRGKLPANPSTRKFFTVLASPSRPGSARISSTPRSLCSLRPFPATLYLFSSTPPPSAGKFTLSESTLAFS